MQDVGPTSSSARMAHANPPYLQQTWHNALDRAYHWLGNVMGPRVAQMGVMNRWKLVELVSSRDILLIL